MTHLPLPTKAPPKLKDPPASSTQPVAPAPPGGIFDFTERLGRRVPVGPTKSPRQRKPPPAEPFIPKAGWDAGKKDVAEQKRIEESIEERRRREAVHTKAPPLGYPFGSTPPKPRRPPPRTDGGQHLIKLDSVPEDPDKQPPPARETSPPPGCQFKAPPPSALPPPVRNKLPPYYGKCGATRAERDKAPSEIWTWYELVPAEDRQFLAPEVIDILLEGKVVREAFFAEGEKKSLQDRIYIPRPWRYRCKVLIGFDVHGTIDDLDNTFTVKNDPRKGPGYLPPSAWHF